MRKTPMTLAAKRAILALISAALLLSMPTHAKISAGTSKLLQTTSSTIWEMDFAFDTETNVGLAVYRQGGKLHGIYVLSSGSAAAPAFNLTTSEVSFARLAARSGGGGGFLIRYYVSGTERVIFVHPDSPTIIGPVMLEADADAPAAFRGGGVAYAPEHDAFLVTYHKNDDTYVKWVRFDGNSLDVQSTPVQLTSGSCSFDASEISWDSTTDRALVGGRRDVDDGCSGALWIRRISFNGSTITALGSLDYIATGARVDDVRMAFSDLIDKWVVVFVQISSSSARPVLKRTVEPDGTLGPLRSILPGNTANSTGADDKFGRDNGLGLVFNPFSGRFLLGARGNDTGGSALAPAFALQLDENGDAVPRTLIEYLPFDAKEPYPRPVPLENSPNFLMVTKAGLAPVSTYNQLRSVIIAADETAGTGNWPLTSGSDVGSGGGGGGGEDPPPPPPSGNFTLTVTKPSGGVIISDGIYCGVSGGTNATHCQTTKPAGTVLTLKAYPASGNILTSWGGCAATVTLNGNVACAPTFGSSSGGSGGGTGGGTGPFTLTITRPSGGLILGQDIYCGTTSSSGTKCQVTRAAGTTISLIALPASGHTLTSWGGCSPRFALNANLTCAPAFSGVSSAPPPSSGSISLRVINPSTPDGGSVFWSGVGWIHGGQSVLKTYTSPTSVNLSVFARPGYAFVKWLGSGCANSMTVNNERVCTVDFDAAP